MRLFVYIWLFKTVGAVGMVPPQIQHLRLKTLQKHSLVLRWCHRRTTPAVQNTRNRWKGFTAKSTSALLRISSRGGLKTIIYFVLKDSESKHTGSRCIAELRSAPLERSGPGKMKKVIQFESLGPESK